MYTGRDTLRSIDTALQEARQLISSINDRVDQSRQGIVQVQRKETQAYKALAEIRLELLLEDEIVIGLGEIDSRATELLDKHQQALDEARDNLDKAQSNLTQLEEQRQLLAARVDRARDVMEQAIEATEARLREDAAYQKQQADLDNAQAVAARAAQKAEQAEQDRVEKGKPYESDRLFMYLWKRKYGLASYKARPLTRFLDAWVARLCDYHNARPNYTMLQDIPKRLREHADYVAGLASEENMAFNTFVEQAMIKDGIGDLRSTLSAEEERLAQMDIDIEQAENHHTDMLNRHTAVARGEEKYYETAMQLLTKALKTQGITSLKQLVRATPLPEDDLIVDELIDLEEEYRDWKEQAQQDEKLVQAHGHMLGELEQIRRRFKNHGFDSSNSEFRDASLISTLLSDFLHGIVSGDTLWETIRRQHRVNRSRGGEILGEILVDVLSNSGGGRRYGGSSWGGRRRSRGQPSGRRTPRPSRSRGGGGFRTGGGF